MGSAPGTVAHGGAFVKQIRKNQSSAVSLAWVDTSFSMDGLHSVETTNNADVLELEDSVGEYPKLMQEPPY
jgi:hypothetical protein